jgi:hypothetical protein
MIKSSKQSETYMSASRKPRVWFVGFPYPASFSGMEKQLDLDRSPNYRTHTDNSGSLLLEYDAVVWNFTEPLIGDIERDRQLELFLKEKKILVYFLNPQRTVPGHNSLLGPVWPILEKEDSGVTSSIVTSNHGRQILLTSYGLVSPFRDYLEHFSRWFVAFKTRTWLVPLALNASDEAVAFSLTKYQRNTFFLPPPLDLPYARIFLDSLIEALGTILGSSEPSPTWTQRFALPGMKEIDAEIQSQIRKISDIEKQKSDSESKLDHLTWIRNTLLSSDGKDLEKAVNYVLTELRYHPAEGPLGLHDLTFEYNDNHFLAEVKGTTGSASEEHVRQLNAMKTRYVEENKKDTKGVLFINAWRQFEPDKRETEGRVIFPYPMMKLVEIWKFCLITTAQLLQIYRLHLQGSLNVEKLAKEINATVGPLKGYALTST